jgi:ABC-type bacteriocin/lantibiotic exporter with double-glycine peptidase domain
MLKILKLLDKAFKFDVIKFYFLLFVVTIFEFLAVFIILPISQVFFKNKIEVSFFLTDYLNSINYETLISISVISLMFIYLIKNIFIIYFSWWKLNFIKKFEEKISCRLIKKYFNKDYNFFQSNTIGNFSNYLTNEVQNFSSCLLSVLQLISESLIFILIAGFLIYYQPQVTSFLVILIIIIAIITGLPLRKFLIQNGEKWVKSSNKLNDFVIQCFNSIIEIKVYSKFNFFSNIFNRYKSENLIFRSNNSIIGDLPKPIFEFILILSFSVLVYYMLSSKDVKNLPEIMSLFLAGAYRLIPAVSRFSVLFQNLNRNKYLIKTFIDQLDVAHDKELIINKNQKSMYNFNEKIEFKNVSFSFKNAEKKIINNVSLLIKKGEKVGIVGKSGSGKTTLLNIFLGFLKANEGNFTIDNNEAVIKDLGLWLTCISYVPQNPVILNDTIKTNIALEHDNINFDKLKFAIDNAALTEDIKKFPNQLETLLGPGGINLSTGQKQRISIARALYKNSQIIILDEPTSALDVVTEKTVLENLFSLKNVTLIMVTHKTNFLDKFDQVVSM